VTNRMLQFSSRYWNLSGQPRSIANDGTTYVDTAFQSGWDVTRGQAGTSGIMVRYAGGAAARMAALVESRFLAPDAGWAASDLPRFPPSLDDPHRLGESAAPWVRRSGSSRSPSSGTASSAVTSSLYPPPPSARLASTAAGASRDHGGDRVVVMT
jgi:hypothetical protein